MILDSSSPSLSQIVRYSNTRRRALLADLPVRQNFAQWEETCVPSYCHANFLARLTSWLRLFAAVDLAKATVPKGIKVLDFGASAGELGRLLGKNCAYHFIEQEEAPAGYLLRGQPHAVRTTLQGAEPGSYDCVFALDALEHNDNFAELIEQLGSKLSPAGVLVLSGPTENWLYKLGRRISGFDSHYHTTNIAAIEKAAGKTLTMLRVRTIPFGVPLFRLSAWRRTNV